CPYQRGSIENVNGLLRQYFPKGTDFSMVTKKALDLAVEQINTRPRMIFDYLSASQVLENELSQYDSIKCYASTPRDH
ncbi:IS30 family transposase, partial [Staphylococcus pseudintermedius]|nr:IS30 family transposase [Staphylococcus pseudintermedius]ELJ9074653.1 IS30 family transposase [Staphylococcus pseudintermedius]